MKLSNKTKPKISKPANGIKNSKVYDWDMGAIVFDKEEPRVKKK